MAKTIKTIQSMVSTTIKNGHSKRGSYEIERRFDVSNNFKLGKPTYILSHHGTVTASATKLNNSTLEISCLGGGFSASDRDSVVTFLNALNEQENISYASSIVGGEFKVYQCNFEGEHLNEKALN